MFLLPRGGLDVDLLPGKPPVGRLEVEARFRDWGSRGKSGIHVRANVRGIFQLPLHDEDVLARAAHELALTAEHHVVDTCKALVFRQRQQAVADPFALFVVLASVALVEAAKVAWVLRSEGQSSELPSLMRN